MLVPEVLRAEISMEEKVSTAPPASPSGMIQATIAAAERSSAGARANAAVRTTSPAATRW